MTRRIHSVSSELIHKSREAALSAVQIFNNPLIKFKSETFIVLMIIAWTYLLHAYYRKKGIEYRYYKTSLKRRKFDRTKSGSFKYWELQQCLDDANCPLDKDTSNNLRFLIALRNEIEHQMTMRLDDYLGGRYQACAMNYNRYIKELFGEKCGIDKYLTYSLQFVELSYEQLTHPDHTDLIPESLQSFILEFDKTLSSSEYNSTAYSYRLYFTKKLVNRPGQADRVVQFVDPESEFAKTIDPEYWVKKEVERPKYLPREIIKRMQEQGFTKFKQHQHTQLWKNLDARNPGKGYGVQVANTWYWYESWIAFVEQHCKENRDLYS